MILNVTGSEVHCPDGLCYNGGLCEKRWNSYVCNCDMTTFTGPRCAQGQCFGVLVLTIFNEGAYLTFKVNLP